MTPRPDSVPSIGRRLLVLLLGPAFAVLLAGATVDYFSGVTPVQDAYDQALVDAAFAVAGHVHSDVNGKIQAHLSPEALSLLRTDAVDNIYFRVTAPDGTFVVGDEDLPRFGTGDSNPSLHDAVFRGQPIRVATYRTGSPSGPVEVTVAETTHKREHIRAQLASTMLATDVIELAAIMALVGIGVQLGLEPLRTLRDQIARRSTQVLAPLDVGPVPLEVRALVEVLNRLLATLKDSSAAQRKFLEDAAHQLRTPLTGIQAQLELLTSDDTAHPVHDRLMALHAATRRLAHTAHQLLALARSDEAANLHWDFTPVDLSTIVEDTVAEHLSHAINAQVDLGAETAIAEMRGVPWLLRELLSNLLQNALTHTPAGGSVTVRCGVEGDSAFLQVVDTGVGIPEDERERVFDRFFRGRHARPDSSGLGLAIVAEVARLHAAQLAITDGPNGTGTAVRVDFPRAQ